MERINVGSEKVFSWKYHAQMLKMERVNVSSKKFLHKNTRIQYNKRKW